MKKVRSTLYVLIFAVILTGCSKKIKTEPYLENRPVYTIGIIFMDNVPKKDQTAILDDLNKLSQLNIVGSQKTQDALINNGYEIPRIFDAEDARYYNNISNFDCLFVFSLEENNILVQYTDFMTRYLSYLNISDSLKNKTNWLLDLKIGFIFVESFEKNLEVYLDSRLIGYTPFLAKLKDGQYNLSLGKSGEVLYSKNITLPNDSHINVKDMGKSSSKKGPVDGIELTKEEKQGTIFIVIIYSLSLVAGIVLPIVLL